jgi:integrase
MDIYTSPLNEAAVAWQWPVDLTSYDHTTQLSDRERETIAHVIAHMGARSARVHAVILHRLVQPLSDVLTAVGCPQKEHYAPILILLSDMHRRGTAYWGWSQDEWRETIGLTREAFEQRRVHRSGPKARQQVVVIAYLLTHFSDFFAFAGNALQLHRTAATIFGRPSLDTATQRICEVLRKRGYSSQEVDKNIQFALALIFLMTRNPSLEGVTYQLLLSLREQASSTMLSDGLSLVSRALTDLHLMEGVLPRRAIARSITARIETEGVPLEWVRWCQAWHDQSPLAEKTKENYLYYLRKIGLWLADQYPGITSPEQWDDTLGFAFVAMVNQMKVGDYVTVMGSAQFAGLGKALSPRSKRSYLTVMRRFFSDLQEIPHRVDERGAHRIPYHFNPMRVFETPHAVQRLIGPDPRVIEDAWWWKLLAAAEALTPEDLPRPSSGFQPYPFTMVRALAITWCYSALRSDEIRRLRVGCIRWQWEQDIQLEDGEIAPPDATCFLHVPVNKTSTAFWKPVYALVGTCINAWEKERPPQPPVLDRKTNQLVDFLFSYRRGRIGDAYLNFVLIPLLCEKAGVPGSDARGRITSHRARATIATLYYNCPDGLTGPEIQEFLGHASFHSTRSYIKANPTKLAKSVARANKNSRLVRVLVDPHAIVEGEPAIFYDLGDGTFCGNPAWASCPHRMACIKCPMHVGAELAQLIRARDGILNLLQEVPDLSEEERAVAEGDRNTLNKLIERYKEVPPPPVPNERYIFNPAALAPPRGKPLTVLNHVKTEGEPRAG